MPAFKINHKKFYWMLEKKQNSSDYFEDKLLLSQIEMGNMTSFNKLYEKHWEDVYIRAYKRLKDSEQAKDIVQEIFTYLWTKRETLEIDNLPAYLNIAVRNKVFKIVAKAQTSHAFFDTLESVSPASLQPDSNLLTKEFFNSYENKVNALPKKKQLIFRLRYNEDMSTKDIAEQLKISRKTVQNQLASAVETLKTSIISISMIMVSLISAYTKS